MKESECEGAGSLTDPDPLTLLLLLELLLLLILSSLHGRKRLHRIELVLRHQRSVHLANPGWSIALISPMFCL
jgi:hypothetical protein